MIRALIEATAGALLILGVAASFLFSEPLTHRVEAGEVCRGAWIKASYYGTESGNRTANGEAFNGESLTAASRTLPFNTRLRVTYHGKSVVVRINDRGPAKWTRRDLDLSRAAAARIGLIHAGVGLVCIERLPK